MEKLYSCPMHPQITSKKPGQCSKCGMDLILAPLQKDRPTDTQQNYQNKLMLYRPLITIIGLILVASITISASTSSNFVKFLEIFMSGFFLVFAGFKLLDLSGFAQGYRTYDLLARKFPKYGYIYPFIELMFGLAIIIKIYPLILNLLIFVVMFVSGIGVVQSLLTKRKFQCACLGTIIKVPLTYVTIIEDFGMSIMALVVILSRR